MVSAESKWYGEPHTLDMRTKQSCIADSVCFSTQWWVFTPRDIWEHVKLKMWVGRTVWLSAERQDQWNAQPWERPTVSSSWENKASTSGAVMRERSQVTESMHSSFFHFCLSVTKKSEDTAALIFPFLLFSVAMEQLWWLTGVQPTAKEKVSHGSIHSLLCSHPEPWSRKDERTLNIS